MQFETQERLSLLTCSTCQNTGRIGVQPCSQCHRLGMAYVDQDEYLLHMDWALTRYAIALRHAKKKLNAVRVLTALVLFGALVGLFVYAGYRRGFLDDIWDFDFWLATGNAYHAILYASLIPLLYLWYRAIVSSTPQPTINYSRKKQPGEQRSPLMMTWAEIHSIPHKKRIDIAKVFAHESQKVLDRSFEIASKERSQELHPVHIFTALLEVQDIASIFVRLGVTVQKLKALLSRIDRGPQSQADPHVGNDASQIIFHAYKEAQRAKQQRVQASELLITTVRQSELLQEMLYDLDIDKQKLANVLEWIRIQHRLRNRYKHMQRVGSSRNKYGLDRAMTAIATPFLNSLSTDLTQQARSGNMDPCVAREKEIEEIFRVIEGGRQSVLLVGEHGVGKMSLIEGIAQRMIAEDVPERLNDKRLMQLSVSGLLAGTTTSGAQQRLIQIANEIKRAGNIILFINNLQDLVGVSGEGEGLDVSETLAEMMRMGGLLTFATTTLEGYNKFIINTQIGQAFARVDVKEMDDNQAIRVLESKAAYIEYQHKVFFSYDAIAKGVVYAGRFLHDQQLPESAIEIVTEAASAVRSKRGENNLVLGEDVASIISDKTGIPTTSISDDESQKLLKLEAAMHQRVVGQEEAVMLVANALRRARAEVRSTKRPIANFLFLGPTGVGKTELAKTISSVYFGGEERMVRIDMSEYQDQSAIYRLIGQPGQKGSGILTEAVRQQPFSLVLLDEMEKADPNVLNLFLQVFDDGRLTDSVGRVIDFTNTIIIATSNAGTQYVADQLRAGVALEDIRQTMIRGELKQYYRPEFLNRFDGIVLFRALERDQIKQIAQLMLESIAHELEEDRGVELVITDDALEALAEVGFDPEFGARPMRRAIQERVQNELAELVLSGKLKRRDRLVLGEGLNIRIER